MPAWLAAAAMAALMEQQLGELASQGWCLLPGVIPEADVRRVRDSVLRTTAEQRNPSAPESIGHVPGLCCFDLSFAPWLASDAVMNLVTALFGPGAKITFCTGQTNYPGCERQEWCAPHPPHPTRQPRCWAARRRSRCALAVAL